MLNQENNPSHDFLNRLKALHEISLQLAQEDTLDNLYRRAIELGLSRLRFDRMGLLRLGADDTTIYGTFGTDKNGNLRDEHAFDATEILERVRTSIKDKKRIEVWQDVTLYDTGPVPIGRGWNAMVSLWDGHDVIGWLSVDNLIHKRPLQDYEKELLSLYGTMIGHLISRKQRDIALAEHEAQLNAAQEIANIGSYEIFLKTRERIWSDQLYRIFGLEIGAHIDGDVLESFTTAEDTQRLEKIIDTIIQTRQAQSIEYDIFRSDGSQRRIHVIARPILDENNNVVRLFGTVQDITERHEAEKRLKYYELMVDNAIDAILSVDLNLKVLRSRLKSSKKCFMVRV